MVGERLASHIDPEIHAMPATLSSDTRPERVRLRVRSAERVATFYSELLGLARRDDPRAGGPVLDTPGSDDGDSFLLALEEDPGAPLRPSPTVGLYHVALLHPDRSALARAVRRVLESGWSAVDGAADHGVSEAFYLRDPEGNGVELYRDRPPGAWPRAGHEVAMTSERLDLDGLLSEADGGGARPAAGPTLGHVHLHVSDLEASRRFYTGILGLRVRQSGYPGALFLAAGDYHHHLGLNVWARGRRAPEGATGLLGYGWRVAPGDLEGIRERARDDGALRAEEDGALRLVDPDGIEMEVRRA